MYSYQAIRQYCQERGLFCVEGEPMKRHTSFQIGGPASLFVKAGSPRDLAHILTLAQREGIPLAIVGRGTNLLVPDEGVQGLVLCVEHSPEEIHLLDECTIFAPAGVALSKLCSFAMEQSLTGLEFAWGIPGSVGGAIYMNAGAYGSEMKDVLLGSCHLDEQNRFTYLPVEQLELSYRHSRYTGGKDCILGGIVRLQQGEQSQIKAKMEEIGKRRVEKQPLDFPSAGSTFKRPEGAYASALIDQCGLKGRQVGGAMVSPKHAGFVVNAGNATSADVLELVRQIQQEVQAQTGYLLECEMIPLYPKLR